MSFQKTLCAIFLFLFLSTTAFAFFPGIINYQGRLTDSDGSPVTSPVQVIVEGEDLLPRKRFTPGAYSFFSQEAESVLASGRVHADAIKSGTVSEARIDESIARDSEMTALKLFDAIVSPSGGEYASIQDALSDGAKSIFVRNGVYELSEDINISESGVVIIGESREGVIFDAGNEDYRIVINPHVSGYNAGTVSVDNNSKVVEGKDTEWSANVSPEEKIRLGANLYEITSVISDIRLVISKVYQGNDIENEEYSISDYKENVRIENLTIINSDGTSGAFLLAYVANCSVRNCKMENNDAPGIRLLKCVACILENNICRNNSNGINISRGSGNLVKNNIFANNEGYGAFITNGSRDIFRGNQIDNNLKNGLFVRETSHYIFEGNTVSYNGDEGFYIHQSNECRLVDNFGTCNKSDQVSLHFSSFNILCGNMFNDGDASGIRVYSSDKNTINGNICKHNYTSGIEVVSSDANSITGNTSIDNREYGINITGSSSHNIAGMNTLTGNVSAAGNDGGVNTHKSTNYPTF